MNISRKLIYMCAAVLTAILSVGCSKSDNGDDPDMPDFEEGIPTEVTITLSARSGNATGTRADGDGEKDPTESIELIHDNWWIVFVDKNGKAKIFEQKDVTDKVQYIPSTLTDAERKGGFEAETFKIIIPSGTYRIYAFANIDRKNISESDFEKNFLKHGNDGTYSGTHQSKYLKDLIGVDKFNVASNLGMQWPDNVNIPMTGVKDEVSIRNTVEEAFNIEVIRAVAKVEFAFHNSTTSNISVKEVSLYPITKNENISFVPNYKAIGTTHNEKLFQDVNGKDENGEYLTTRKESEYGTLKFSNLTDPSNLSLTTDESGEYSIGKFRFYCKESLPKKDGSESFTITLTIDNGGKSQTKNFDTQRIKYINRNDWILFPIRFNNWVIKWKLHTYPPIGGYPPVFNQSGSGETLEATMTTGGEFELYPDEITQNGQKYTVDWAKDVVIEEVIDPKGMLIGTPTLKENTNSQLSPVNSDKVIVGELDPKKEGEAKIKINFYLKDQDSKSLDEVYTCTFTITRKNGTN